MTFKEWPQWMRTREGERRVFQCPEDVPPGWMTVDDYRALHPFDHDGDGKPGGSLKAPRRRRIKE